MYYVLSLLFMLWFTWVMFAALMNAKRVRAAGQLKAPARVFAYVALGIGYPLDVLCMLVFCVVLLDAPQEFTLSGKLWRLSQRGGRWGWQRTAAEVIRSSLLDNFDPDGVHHG
jgi:hypothetical protein